MKFPNKAHRDQPLVSIAIPCYNHEKYVHECILSIINQDYQNIELIIIDDGSSDYSARKIQALTEQCEKRFTRFEFRSRPNKGLCATLNEAIDWCNGIFFSAIASDDVITENKVSTQLKEYFKQQDKNTISAIFSGYCIMNSSGKIIKEKIYKSSQKLNLKSYYGRRWLCASTALIRTEHLKGVGKYDEELPFEDLDMWIRLLKNTDFLVIPDPLVLLRKHESNMSNNSLAMFIGEMRIYWKHKNNILYPIAVLASIKNLIKSNIFRIIK